MQQLYARFLERPLCAGHCVTCDETCVDQFCSKRCESNFAVLSGHHQSMSLGLPVGGKRLLEADNEALWDSLPDDLAMALLDASFPRRETNWPQFRSLARFRAMNHRYARLVEQIYAYMTRLPRGVEKKLDDTQLALFPGLQRLWLPEDTDVTAEGLMRLPRLARLALNGTNPITMRVVVTLPSLVRLKLHNYNLLVAMGVFSQLRDKLRSLTVIGDWRWADARPVIRDNDIASFTALQRLKLSNVSFVSDAQLAQLTGLQTLVLGHRVNEQDDRGVLHTDAALSALTGLTDLTLHSPRPGITGAGLGYLTGLQRLVLGNNRQIDDVALQGLGNLRELRLKVFDGFNRITDAGLQALPLLSTLELSGGDVTNAGVTHLTGLTKLILYHNSKIDDRALAPLARLHTLTLRGKTHITREGLRRCKALRRLDVYTAVGMRAIAFLDAYEWLPTLRRLRVGAGYRRQMVDVAEVLYKVYTDDGKIERRLQDHLPVGCHVEVPDSYSFRVVARIDDRAQIVQFPDEGDELVWHD